MQRVLVALAGAQRGDQLVHQGLQPHRLARELGLAAGGLEPAIAVRRLPRQRLQAAQRLHALRVERERQFVGPRARSGSAN